MATPRSFETFDTPLNGVNPQPEVWRAGWGCCIMTTQPGANSQPPSGIDTVERLMPDHGEPFVDIVGRAESLLEALNLFEEAQVARVKPLQCKTRARNLQDKKRIQESARHSKAAQKIFLQVYNLGRQDPVGEDASEYMDAVSSFSQMYGVGSPHHPDEQIRKRENRELLRRNLTVLVTGLGTHRE